MRGNSDLSETYPFSVAPANGWGNPNPNDEWVIDLSSVPGQAVIVDANGEFDIVDRSEATRYTDASSAAIASGKVAEWYRSTNTQAA